MLKKASKILRNSSNTQAVLLVWLLGLINYYYLINYSPNNSREVNMQHNVLAWQHRRERICLQSRSESEIAQSCPTLCNPMDCSQSGSSIDGIFQARILAWVAISFSRGSSRPRDRAQVSHIAGRLYRLSHQGILSSIPRRGRSPGEGNGCPLQHSCLGDSMGKEAWWATVHGVADS